MFHYYYDFDNYAITLHIVLAGLLIFRVLCSYLVFINAKRRQLDTPVYWALISFFAGSIALILYFALNYKQGNGAKPDKRKIAVFVISFVVPIVLFTSAAPAYVMENAKQYEYNTDTVVYKKSLLKYVTYDKMGKEYSVLDLSKNYELVDCYTENGEPVNEYANFYINKDGWAVIFDDDELESRYYEDDECYLSVFADKYKNIYFESGDCSWDENGNMVFYEERLGYITHDDTKPEDYDYYE